MSELLQCLRGSAYRISPQDVVARCCDWFDGLATYPACRGYVARATARPGFVKAHADQMAHFAAAD